MSDTSKLGVGVDYGDYSGLAFVDGTIDMTWTDNSNSTGDNPDHVHSLTDVYFDHIKLADGEHSIARGSSTGIGIAVAVNVAQVTSEATIGNATITADGVIVQAVMLTSGDDSSHHFSAKATSGASGADTGVAGSLAINIGLSHAHATLAPNATVTVTDSGDVKLIAQDFALNEASADAHQSKAGKVGVGASIALTIASDTALATTARDLTAAGAVTFSARSTGSDDAVAKASSAGGEETPAAAKDGKDQGGGISNQIHNQRDFADKRGAAAGAKAGTTASTDGKTAAEGEGGSVQVAGAVGVAVALSTSQASIPDGRTIIAGNGTGVTDGSLTLRAQNNTDASASADASAVVINTLAFNPAAGKDVDASADTITLHTGHGLATGDKVAFRR